jgi:hypothetical protein
VNRACPLLEHIGSTKKAVLPFAMALLRGIRDAPRDTRRKLVRFLPSA